MIVYNEIDPFAAAWLRELIKANLIAPGEVWENDIRDIRPIDLRGVVQFHGFAGIGVWSYAARRAGWPDSRPLWTMSCPCQPFSAAGAGGGFADERHLWPHAHWLVRECRPPVIVGEQVASKDADAWIDLVQADLEAVDYAFGAVPFPSASVGAPHIRDRNYWMAYDAEQGRQPRRRVGDASDGRRSAWIEPGRLRDAGGLDDDDEPRLEGQRGRHQAESGRERQVRSIAPASQSGGMAYADNHQSWSRRDGGSAISEGFWPEPGRRGDASRLADASSDRRSEQRADLGGRGERSAPEGLEQRFGGSRLLRDYGWTGPVNGFWRDADWLHCRDGKWRPVEPGAFPLAHGAPARVGRLRGYGNAINAVQAQIFIETVIETIYPQIDDRHFRVSELSLSAQDEGIFA